MFKNIQRIKNALPEVFHVAMFYNNGTIFQTTFEQDINIPKLGENIAELLNHVRRIYEICNFKLDDYLKLIFETDNVSLIILKLGEDSNLALFFKKTKDANLKLQSIKRYIVRIEELVDMDKVELIFQELSSKEEDLKNLLNQLISKEQETEKLRGELKNKEEKSTEKEIKEISKEIDSINDECSKIKLDITSKKEEIVSLKEKIEQEKNI